MTKEISKKLNEIITFVVNNGHKENEVEHCGITSCTEYSILFKEYNGKVCIFSDEKTQIGNPVHAELPIFATHHIFDSELSELSKIVVFYENEKIEPPHIEFHAVADKDLPCCRVYIDSDTKEYKGISDDRIDSIYYILTNI